MDVCLATWLPRGICDCSGCDGSVCWECHEEFEPGECVRCGKCDGMVCPSCETNECKGGK